MKCSHCGLESDLQDAFIKRKHWFGLVKRAYCPACWEKVFIREQLESIVIIAVFVAIVDAFTFRHGAWSVAADVLSLVVISYPIIVAHELAHALVGGVLGIRVFKIRIGHGPALFSRRGFGISWELNLWPFGGGTLMIAPPQPGNRARMFAAVLAGPVVHVVLLAAGSVFQTVLLTLEGWFGTQVAVMVNWTWIFLSLNLLLLIGNLLPTRSVGASGRLGTDGWELLHLLLQKPEEEKNWNLAYYWMEAMDSMERSDHAAALRWTEQGLRLHPEQPGLTVLRGNALIKLKRFAEARGIYAGVLPFKEAKEPVFRYTLYNNIAFADILLKDPQWLPEADQYSAEALRHIGWSPAIIGTRGAVLVEMGRPDEGIRLLLQAMAKEINTSDKASDAFHLAVAERWRGNDAESRRYLALARKYDPNFFLLDSPGWEWPAAATSSGL